MKNSLIYFFVLITPLIAELPEPYNSIVDLPFDGQGWFGNQEPLSALMKVTEPKIVIEVGSWLGCSTRFIAEHLPDEGKVYAVDTWRGSSAEAVHMNDPRLPRLYQLFLSNVKHAGLTHKIIPVRMDSLEAAVALTVQADLIYLDAAHDTASVTKDILAWYPHLKEGGVLCGDDWSWPTVRKAVVDVAKSLGKKVHTSGNFWWYE